MKNRPEFAAYALVGLVVAAVTVLAALGVAVPDVLPYIAVGALGVGGGVALPRDTTAASTTPAEPAPAIPAPTAAPALESLSPVATHAP